MGGRGIDGFMHIAFAGPPSGVAPVATYGAIFSTQFTNGSTFSLLVFDPQDQTGWHKPFTEGVNFSPSVAFRGTTFGHHATHTFAATLSTQEGTDLADLPQVLLPPAQQQIGTRRGPFNINYTYEQYFFQDAKNPSAGWGMFAKAAIADGNPNTLQDTRDRNRWNRTVSASHAGQVRGRVLQSRAERCAQRFPPTVFHDPPRTRIRIVL
jgi:porin